MPFDNAVPQMNYVFWVMDDLLGGRPGPVRAPWDADELWAGGLRSIVPLNHEPGPAEIAGAGLRHHSLPLPPILPVTDALQEILLDGLEEVLDRKGG
jgi:hypothetical protein